MSLLAQQDALTKVVSVLKSGRDRIAAVDPDLKAGPLDDRIRAIREETMNALAGVRADMAQRAKAAAEALDGWTQAAARRRAKFADDPTSDAMQRMAIFETLRRVPTGGLVEHLRDAIAAKNIARAEAARLEFQSRSDASDFAEAFGNEFKAVVDENAQQVEAELRRIVGVAEFGGVLMQEFGQDRSNPTGRIAAARAAGLVKEKSS